MLERLAMAKGEKKSMANMQGAVKDIEKQRKRRVNMKGRILQSIEELGKHGMMLNKEGKAAKDDERGAKDDASPAKRCRMSFPVQTNLTGAHGEPRQGQ
ncbi:unnamed protein product [Urochloa humidicola]